MKKLTLFLLGLACVIYVLIGGAVFMALESSNESDTKTSTRAAFTDLLAAKSCISATELETFVRIIISAYDQGIIATEETDSASLWDYGNSVFFAMTAVTTIGYGNQTPATSGGRAFVVFFALVGIPMVALFLAGIAEKILGVTKRIQEKKISEKHPVTERRLKAVLIPFLGLLILLFLPAGIFTRIEGWTYGESLYYCVVTLTTIGFGDFVIGSDDSSARVAYRLLTGVWIVIGLAWCASLISHGTDLYKDFTVKAEEKVGKKENKEEKEDKNSNSEDKGKTNLSMTEMGEVTTS